MQPSAQALGRKQKENKPRRGGRKSTAAERPSELRRKRGGENEPNFEHQSTSAA